VIVRAVLALAVVVSAIAATAATARSTETVVVSNTSAKPVSSSTVLERGIRYRLVASGTVSDWCGKTGCPAGNADQVAQPNVGVDALYCYAKWRCATPELWRQLRVNGKGLDEAAGFAGKVPYSASHRYAVEICGTGSKLSLVSSDAAAGSTADNSGAFRLQVTRLAASSACPKPTPPKPPAAEVKAAVEWSDGQLGSERWAGRCQRFVESAYGAKTGFASANAAAQSIGLRSGQATAVPKGALVFFRPNCPGATGKYGHVGISLGGGMMISALGEVTVTDLRTDARWRSAFSGWTYPPAAWPGR
jgi:hypothetical protein